MMERPAIFALLAAKALAAFGPAFSTGPVADGYFIRESISTLIVPQGNTPFAGDASLWVGMGTSNGDLIQSILNRHVGDGTTECVRWSLNGAALDMLMFPVPRVRRSKTPMNGVALRTL